MPVAAAYPTQNTNLAARFARVVLGENPAQQRAVKRLLLISHAYAVCMIFVSVLIATGFAPRSAWLGVAYVALGQSTFYAVLRGGYTLHLKDPLFCFPQALFGVSCIVAAYAWIPFAQGNTLQVLFVLLVYDMHRLTARQIGFISTTAVFLLAVLVAIKWHLQPGSIDLRQEALNLSMAVLLVPMLSTVSGAVRRVYINQMEKRAELDTVLGELKTLSQRDVLTGAINRRHMMELLNKELKRQCRTQRPFSVAMLDIDFFKRVNDTHGHAVGDVVLKRLTALARETLRETDVVARWGGEEFLVLLPVSTTTDAAAVIDKLRQRVEQHDWTQYAPGLHVTFSGGIAEHALDFSLDQTIERADGALYRAKEHGRNRVEQA